MIGTIKFYAFEKCFGFIEIENGLDFFFHGTSVLSDGIPQKGDECSFWLEDDPRDATKLRAVEVQVTRVSRSGALIPRQPFVSRPFRAERHRPVPA
jgi:cold shock CspA family protein